MGLITRIRSGWNAFIGRDPTELYSSVAGIGNSYGYYPDRRVLSGGSEKTIVNSIYNRIAVDVSKIDIEHVRTDEAGRFLEPINSGFNDCLTLEANKDQTGRSFIQDIALSLFDEGVIAVVPVDTDKNPKNTDSYDIWSMRVGKIIAWYPDHVKVHLYNDRTGQKEDVVVEKRSCAIITNPFYSVMNTRNGTVMRLRRKLALLDLTDDDNASGKLDIIMQLPYTIHSVALKQRAEARRKDIEDQLKGSKYGIAYADATEKITQLNRPAENQLQAEVESLTKQLYSQLNITDEILNGSANEQTMLNYYDRTVEPVVQAIVDEMKRKFLSKTARSQGQSIMFFRDPFKLVPVSQVADIADKLTRNEVLTSNEVRQILGMRPSSDPGADELRNKNMPIDETGMMPQEGQVEMNPDLSPEEQQQLMQQQQEE